ncbi:MAG: TetR/AcrR family transcriptional regulator [Synergistaceae bacterium]|nr:TetR/AcrR family transcriptional regulator [Synergistaceae bacterium]
MRRTKESALETRRKLLDSALDVMSEKPLPSVSMSEIARRIGLSKGAVYWHFKNKNDLLASLLIEMCEDVWSSLFEPDALPEGFAGLRCFFGKKILAGGDSEHIRRMLGILHRRHEWPQEVAERVIVSLKDMAVREQELVSDIIGRAQADREIRGDIPAKEISLLLSAVFHGIFFYQIHGQMHELYEMDFAKYTDFIFSALERELRCGDSIVRLSGGAEYYNLKETV